MIFQKENIRLRDIKEKDITFLHEYVNNEDVLFYINPKNAFLFTEKDEKDWFKKMSAFENNYEFVIENIENNEIIGICGFNEIDFKNSNTIIGIFIKKEMQNKGYGKLALKILINFAFDELNLNKIKLNVFSFNPNAIKLYEKLGFKTEGILKNELFRFGKYHNVINMAILKKDTK